MDKYKVVDAEQLDADLTEIADEVRILTDTIDTMTVDEITSNIAQVNADVNSQTDLIAQIKTALEGKAAGNGSEVIAEIASLIDQSGVLDSTDGTVTVTEKISKVLKMAKWKNYIQQGLYFRPSSQHLIFADIDNPDILDLDFSKTTYMANMFRANPSLIEFIMDLIVVINVNSFLASSPNLKKVILTNTQGVQDWRNAFNECRKLVSIETLDLSGATVAFNNTFGNCYDLETIKIVPETIKINISFWQSSKLSAESKQSIFDGLATVTTAQTLTLPTNLKILQSQVDSANAKGWTVAGGTVVSEEEYYG